MDRHFKRLRPLPGEDGSGCYFISELIRSAPQVIGGIMGAGAAEDAAAAQVAAGEGAKRKAKQLWQFQRNRLAPYAAAGERGLGALETGLGLAGEPGAEGRGDLIRRFGAEDFEADPGYQFRLAEGQKAINRAAAARGQWGNPATAKELGRYSQGVASQAYGDAWSRWNAEQANQYNRLRDVTGIGQTAADQTQGAINAYQSAYMPAQMAIGNAAASGRLNAANAMIQGMTGGASSAIDQYNMNRLIGMYGPGGTAATPAAPASAWYGGRR